MTTTTTTTEPSGNADTPAQSPGSQPLIHQHGAEVQRSSLYPRGEVLAAIDGPNAGSVALICAGISARSSSASRLVHG